MAHNPGMDIDLGWINGIGSINLPAVKRRAESLSGRRTVKVNQILNLFKDILAVKPVEKPFFYCLLIPMTTC